MLRTIKKTCSVAIVLFFIVTSATASPLITNMQTDDKDKLVELEVKSIKPYPDNAYVIELTKKGEDVNWVLPMVIGGCEAIAVARTHNNTTFPRPLTYDLFISIFNNTSVKLKHIVITKLEDNTFYANIILEEKGKTIEIDARPSDSINIAMKAKAPIFATQAVLDVAKENTR